MVIPSTSTCVLQRIAEHPLVLVLRDRDSVEELSAKVQHARKIVLVGNGGIAMELAHALQGVEVLALSSVFDRKGKGALPVLLLLQLWEPTTFVEQVAALPTMPGILMNLDSRILNT